MNDENNSTDGKVLMDTLLKGSYRSLNVLKQKKWTSHKRKGAGCVFVVKT